MLWSCHLECSYVKIFCLKSTSEGQAEGGREISDLINNKYILSNQTRCNSTPASANLNMDQLIFPTFANHAMCDLSNQPKNYILTLLQISIGIPLYHFNSSINISHTHWNNKTPAKIIIKILQQYDHALICTDSSV